MRLGIALALSVLWLSSGARADDLGVMIEPIRFVNNNAATDSPSPWNDQINDSPWARAVATDGNGVWVVIWGHTWHDSLYPCAAHDMQYARSVDDGFTWTDPAYMNPDHQSEDPTQCDQHPDHVSASAIATDRSGNWLVYGLYNDEAHGSDNDLGVWRSTDNGVTWQGPVYLNNDAGSDGPNVDDLSPTIVSVQGVWVAVWQRWVGVTNGYEDYDLVEARSLDGGATWSNPVTVLSQSGPVTESAPLIETHDGEIGIIWEAATMTLPRTSTIHLTRSQDAGLTWNTPTTLDSRFGGIVSFVMLDDAWVMAMVRPRDPPTNWWETRAMVSRSTTHGILWSDPVEVAQMDGYNTYGAMGCVIVGDRHRNAFIVTASDVDPLGQQWQHLDSYIIRSRDAGATWTYPPTPLNSDFAVDTRDVSLSSSDVSDSGRWLFVGGRGFINNFSPFADSDVVATGFNTFDIEVVDPNPDLLAGAEVTTDSVLLATVPARKVAALAADGLTRVLVRIDVPSEGTVDFNVRGLDDTDVSGVGWLAAPGASTGGADYSTPTVALAGNRFAAYAVLRAPKEFTESATQSPDADWHLLNVNATFHPSGGGGATSASRQLAVTRPPVLLMHGIFSDGAKAWNQSAWPLLYDNRFYWVTGDYRSTNDRPFAVNVPTIWRWARTTLESYRHDWDAAATQLDYIGHSMGGILGRMYAADVNHDYVRDNNFGAGDFRKLITVDTPHWGSPVANAIEQLRSGPPAARRPIQVLEALTGLCTTCGAVHDLRTDSTAIAALTAVDVPTHAVAGIGGDAFLGSIASANAPDVGIFARLLFAALASGIVKDELFGGADHDLLVTLPSQTGGLPSTSMISPFGFVSFASGDRGVHTTVTVEERVGSEVVALLDTPLTETSIWGTLPSASPITPTLSLPSYGQIVPGLSIAAPFGVQHVSPGATIVVTIDTTNGFVPVSVQIESEWTTQTLTTPPYAATITIPQSAIGATTIRAYAYDASWNYAESIELPLMVDVAASINWLAVGPWPLVLYSRMPSAQLTVIGQFSDGVDRDLTSSATGTIYWSDDPSVLTVGPEGVVTATSPGKAHAFVQNGESVGTLLVEVRGVPMRLSVASSGPSWTLDDEARAYDVVRGDLGLLRSTGGDFTLAIDACLAAATTAGSFSDPASPPPGQGRFYLLRARYADARDPGTWDDGSPFQVSDRDAEIAASGSTCP